jgi:hypothetical protein
MTPRRRAVDAQKFAMTLWCRTILWHETIFYRCRIPPDSHWRKTFRP